MCSIRETRTLPLSSSRIRTLSGRSRARLGAASMSGVPALGCRRSAAWWAAFSFPLFGLSAVVDLGKQRHALRFQNRPELFHRLVDGVIAGTSTIPPPFVSNMDISLRVATDSSVREEKVGSTRDEVANAGRGLSGYRFHVVGGAIVPVGRVELGHGEHVMEDMIG